MAINVLHSYENIMRSCFIARKVCFKVKRYRYNPFKLFTENPLDMINFTILYKFS